MIKKGLWVFIILLTVSCDRSKPEQEADTRKKDLPPSRINIEVDFPIKELEAGVNSVLKTQLLDATLPIGKEGDTLFLKIKKNAKLNLAVKGLTAYAAIPLEIEVAVKQKVMGISFSTQDSPVIFNGTATAKADFDINENWDLTLDCSWLGLELSSTPSIKVMGLKIDIEGLVNSQLEKNQDKISDAICTALNQTVDFRGMMTNVWADMQKPIRIAKKDFKLWLNIAPETLGAQLKSKNDTISFLTTLVSNFEISPIPSEKKPSTLPRKGLPEQNASYLLAYIDASFPFDIIAEIAELQLGRMPITVQGYQSVVKAVKISADKGNKIKIDLSLAGDYAGGITVIGKPHLSDDYILTVKDFKFKLSPEGELADAADWMLEEFIGSYIDQYLEFDLKKQINMLDSLANAGIAKEPLGDKINFALKVDKIQPYYLDVQKDRLSWVMLINGKLDIDLKQGIFKKH
ncbi:MAG: DUF4403 family protein [Cyclobacteriaceae bacterium]